MFRYLNFKDQALFFWILQFYLIYIQWIILKNYFFCTLQTTSLFTKIGNEIKQTFKPNDYFLFISIFLPVKYKIKNTFIFYKKIKI